MKTILTILFCLISLTFYGQYNFDYNFNTNGRRVCLVSSTTTSSSPQVIINFHDNPFNTSENYTIKRRPINTQNWTTVASNISATATTWIDTNVTLGSTYEYQVSRNTGSQTATGYLTSAIDYDQTPYKGQMILVIDNTFESVLSSEILQLKKDLTNEGWFVNELFAPRATTWETEASIVTIKNQIINIYNNAPENDKPSHLFLLGHVPIARSGLDENTPDGHDENKGARGADCYYADLDGVFTDTETYDPGTIDVKAINLPNDLKWDQDYIPSELEMAFGRVDFADFDDPLNTEIDLIRNYLNRLHAYRIVDSNYNMGRKTAFNFGYDNSNDGSYRSLIPISGIENVDEFSGNTSFAEWVQQNGPYQIFMQNIVTPDPIEWEQFGMDATIYSSDQSYWGFWDDPQTTYGYGFIRYLLSRPTKCLGILWTTTGVNIFHQPGMGETMGWSIKRIMDHNSSNNMYQKPPQSFDTPDFWGRTHFQYNGDPTLRLNQVKPASDLIVSSENGVNNLNWSASTETNLLGYHVYKSDTEFGIYNKLTSTPINQLNYSDSQSNNDSWYMVRAIKQEITGSGSYLNPSIGISATDDTLSITENEFTAIKIYPNPTKDFIWIKTEATIISKKLTDIQGKVIFTINDSEPNIELRNLNSGIYFLEVSTQNDAKQTFKCLKI